MLKIKPRPLHIHGKYFITKLTCPAHASLKSHAIFSKVNGLLKVIVNECSDIVLYTELYIFGGGGVGRVFLHTLGCPGSY